MDLSLANVNHKQLQELMWHILGVCHSLIIRGGVGIGKTYGVYLYAQLMANKMNRKLVVWKECSNEFRKKLAHEQEFREQHYIMAVFDTLNKLPEDTAGIPMPVNGFIDWKPPMLMYILAQPGASGVLFLDELMQAQQAVQKPLADLFLNKQIGDLVLQKEVGVVAASNALTDKCGVIQMLEHQKNRLAHCTLEPPTANEWCEWAAQNDIDARIIMFIRSCPDMLYRPVSNRKEDAFETPRSWHILSDCIKDVDHVSQKKLFLVLVATRVGSGAAAKFKAVLDHDMSKRGPEMLADPSQFDREPWDRQVAFTLWLGGWAKDKPTNLERALEFLNQANDNGLLDTMLYMMRQYVGTPFVRAITGTTRYQGLRDTLISLAKDIGGN